MFPSRFPVRAGVTAAVAAGAVALAGVVTACGSSAAPSTSVTATRMSGSPSGPGASSGQASAGSSPASPAPAASGTLSGTAASALAAQAIANTRAAGSVRVAGQGISSGSGASSGTVSFAITLVKDAGCQGTIALSKAETFRLVQTGGYVWMLPSTAYYQSLHLSKAAVALVSGKYIKVKASNKQIASLTTLCSSSGLFGTFPTPSGAGYQAAPSSYNGGPAYEITRPGKSGSAVVSSAARPLLLKISDTGADGGAITFGDYDTVTTITPPPAAQTIDGSQLGL